MEFIIKLLSQFFRDHFLQIWLTILVAILFSVFIACFKGFRSHLNSIRRIKTKLNFHALSSLNFLEISGIIAFVFFLVFYIFLIFYKQDFADFDNDVFTDNILRGKFYEPPIWPEQGRFFPLGHQEWNLIKLITRSQSPTWYLTLPTLQFLLVIILLFFLLKGFSIWLQLTVVFLLITTPSFVHSFFDLRIISERNIIVWIMIFILAFKAYLRSNNSLAFGLVLIATHFALYYKEPVFILLTTFASIRLIYFVWNEQNLWKQSLKRFLSFHKIEVAILILCFIFTLLYGIINLPYRSLSYTKALATDSQTTLFYYLQSNALLSIFLIMMIGRLIYLLFWQKAFNFFWDSLAVGAIVYFLFYVKISLANDYFLAPVDLIIILYIINILQPILEKSWSNILLIIIGSIIVIQNIYLTPKIITYRLNFIDGRVQIVDFLKTYSQQENINELNLYFPYVKEPFVIYNFSCFLKYKNLQNDSQVSYRLTSSLKFYPNNKCAYWNSNHDCFQVKSPKVGDLIIILPGYIISQKSLTEWQKKGVLLFHYQPFPSFSPMHAYIFKKLK